jgi:dTDP-4-amino-4,6-dideoxygalactose transaminase
VAVEAFRIELHERWDIFRAVGELKANADRRTGKESTMRYDAVVSTLNRPDSLKAYLSLIEGQTEKPARVLIVDASDDQHKVKANVMQRNAAIEWTFLRSDTKSLLNKSTHRQPPSASIVQAGGLPATERLTGNTLILPLFHQMTESDQSRVLDLLAGRVTES